jgi:hypothetical protein
MQTNELVTVLLVTPGVANNLRLLVETESPALDYTLCFWCTGVYEVLNPEGTTMELLYTTGREEGEQAVRSMRCA